MYSEVRKSKEPKGPQGLVYLVKRRYSSFGASLYTIVSRRLLMSSPETWSLSSRIRDRCDSANCTLSKTDLHVTVARITSGIVLDLSNISSAQFLCENMMPDHSSGHPRAVFRQYWQTCEVDSIQRGVKVSISLSLVLTLAIAVKMKISDKISGGRRDIVTTLFESI